MRFDGKISVEKHEIANTVRFKGNVGFKAHSTHRKVHQLDLQSLAYESLPTVPEIYSRVLSSFLAHVAVPSTWSTLSAWILRETTPYTFLPQNKCNFQANRAANATRRVQKFVARNFGLKLTVPIGISRIAATRRHIKDLLCTKRGHTAIWGQARAALDAGCHSAPWDSRFFREGAYPRGGRQNPRCP